MSGLIDIEISGVSGGVFRQFSVKTPSKTLMESQKDFRNKSLAKFQNKYLDGLLKLWTNLYKNPWKKYEKKIKILEELISDFKNIFHAGTSGDIHTVSCSTVYLTKF